MAGSITIVGAGIAGLAAGCYGRMNGYRTRILEMHDRPGGLCTAWQRQGYTVDGCLHWLAGSGPGMELHRIWLELGAVQGRRFVDHDAYVRLELPERTFTLYTDLDRLGAYLLELAPEDGVVIRELIGGARDLARIDMPVDKPPELFTAEDEVRLAPFIRFAGQWAGRTMGELTGRLQSPVLRLVLPMLWPDPMPALFSLLLLAYAHRRSAGYPVGGSLEFARAIERRYLDLGGEISYNTRVTGIVVEHDRAVGVRVEDGSQLRAEGGDVISCADGRTTIFDWLEGRYADDKIRTWYAQVPIIPSPIQVTLGVGMPLDAPPSIGGTLFAPPAPIEVGGQSVGLIGVQVFSFDPTAAPPGKSVLRVMLPGDYACWQGLRQTPERYRAEKERIAQQVIAALAGRFPGLAAHVEMVDVATPATFARYTGNWQGSGQGWILTPQMLESTLPPFRSQEWRLAKTLPGLDRLYMAGQWVEPGGGVPSVALSARQVIQLICARDGRPFTTTVP